MNNNLSWILWSHSCGYDNVVGGENLLQVTTQNQHTARKDLSPQTRYTISKLKKNYTSCLLLYAHKKTQRKNKRTYLLTRCKSGHNCIWIFDETFGIQVIHFSARKIHAWPSHLTTTAVMLATNNNIEDDVQQWKLTWWRSSVCLCIDFNQVRSLKISANITQWTYM